MPYRHAIDISYHFQRKVDIGFYIYYLMIHTCGTKNKKKQSVVLERTILILQESPPATL